jgi:outer membrane lipoprotein-sorting protein
MRRIYVLLTLFLGLFHSGFSQTADDVINKYVEAMGGMEKLQSIKSFYSEEVAVMPNGMEITTRTYKVQGQLYRVEREFGMGTMTTVVTDKEAWMASPRSGGSFEPMQEEMAKTLRPELDCLLPLVNYASKGNTVELTGTEVLSGVNCYVLKLTTSAGRAITYFIDSKNWLVVRSSTKGGRMMFGGGGGRGGGGGERGAGGGGGGDRGGERNREDFEIVTDYSDYKKTADGYLFPMTTTRPGMGGGTMSSTIEKIEVNKPVDPKLYKPE